MASVVRQWMITRRPGKRPKTETLTRLHRRETTLELVGLLRKVLEDEEAYRDAIPEVFETRRDSADWACDKLEEAIGCLEEAY